MVKVKNIHGTADNSVPSGFSSWLDFWEKSTNRKANKCANTDCNQKATIGGHIKKVNGSNDWYIVPLCDKCNNYNNDEEFYVNQDDLVKI